MPESVQIPVGVISEAGYRSPSARYIEEVLGHAGLFYAPVRAADLPTQAGRYRLLVLPGSAVLTTEQREALRAFVRQGGGLLGLAGPSGLEEVFGARGGAELTEGFLQVTARRHPVTRDLHSSLHVFAGQALYATEGTVLAELDSGGLVGEAIVENAYGAGTALLIGPDLLHSIVHIQQGLPIVQDGPPAPDGSAPLDDGILKSEDGFVLDWVRDRQVIFEAHRAFLEPITDELRELILKSLFHLATRQRVLLPLLWCWPGDLTAVAHLSHDTDGNDPALGEAMRQVTAELEINSTWCILYPGGYDPEFYRLLQNQGDEIALHYDARTGGRRTRWGEDHFRVQHDWLCEMSGLDHLISNKNHYLRWEGRLEFFHWCERVGLQCDETKGPSKIGSIGYILGGSHPWFPYDEEENRFLDVLEVHLLTQDLVITCPPEFGPPLVDSAVRHYGVGHFLFHPAHIQKPGVADTLRQVVGYGREQGMVWWTGAHLNAWERSRRAVSVERWHGRSGEVGMTFRVGTPLRNAALLCLQPDHNPLYAKAEGQPTLPETVTRYGFPFAKLNLDLSTGTELTWQVAGEDI